MAVAAPPLSMAATPSTSLVLHPKSLCFHYSHHHLSTKLNFSLSSSPFLKLKSLTSHLPPSHQFLPSCTWENSLLPTAFSEDEDDEVASVPSPSASGRGGGEGGGGEGRLYVGNLPYAMTSSQLSGLFGEAGRVSSVEIVYDRVTDRSRGFAFVTMASVEEAKHAIRMFDGSQVGGRTVKVNFPEVPRGGEREVMGPKIRSSYKGFIDSSYKIYAGNLAWSLTSQGLREAFADHPGLLSAKVIYERDSGRSRGFGFISFASADEMLSALNAMDGVEVEGRPLRLNAQTDTRASSTPQETK